MCISICINAQITDSIEKETNLLLSNNVSEMPIISSSKDFEDIRNEIKDLKQHILTIQNTANDVAEIKEDIERHSEKILSKSSISDLKTLKNRINILEKSLGESNVIIQKDIDDINVSLDVTQNQLDSANNKLINQGDEIIETKLSNDKTSMLSLISLILGVLLIVALIVIYRLTSKNISSNKNEIKDILTFDNDLKNILDKHTQLLEQNKVGNSKEETLKSLKIVADEIMTMENNIYQMTHEEQNSRGLKRIKRAIKNLRNNYKTMGYDIPELLGSEWKEGDVIEIIGEIPDENIEKGKRIITRVESPRIDFNGEMIQRAKVELKSNI